MKTQTLWQIVIKAIGIYVLLQFVSIAPQLFVNVFQIAFLKAEETVMVFQAVVTIFTISLYALIIWFTIFRTNSLINRLKLSERIDEDMLDLNISKAALLNIAVIVIGGVTFAESLPNFCHQLFLYFIDINTYDGFKKSPHSPWLIEDGLKLIIGYLLVSFHKSIVNFIIQRTN